MGEIGPAGKPHVDQAVHHHPDTLANGREDDLAAHRLDFLDGEAVGLEHGQRLTGGELVALEHRDLDRVIFLQNFFEGLDTGGLDDHRLRGAGLAERRQHAEVVLLAGRSGAFPGHAGQSVFEHRDVGGFGRGVDPFDVGPTAPRNHRRRGAGNIGLDVFREGRGGLEIATTGRPGGQCEAFAGESGSGPAESKKYGRRGRAPHRHRDLMSNSHGFSSRFVAARRFSFCRGNRHPRGRNRLVCRPRALVCAITIKNSAASLLNVVPFHPMSDL